MLKTLALEDLDHVLGGNGFSQFGGWEAWKTSQRGQDYRHFLQLRQEGKVRFGRNGEWGGQYARYMNNLTAGSRNPLQVAPRGSRQDNMPRPPEG